MNTDIPIIISSGINYSSRQMYSFDLLKVMRRIIENIEIDNRNEIPSPI